MRGNADHTSACETIKNGFTTTWPYEPKSAEQIFQDLLNCPIMSWYCEAFFSIVDVVQYFSVLFLKIDDIISILHMIQLLLSLYDDMIANVWK